MNEKTTEKKPAWRTASELNPELKQRHVPLIVAAISGFLVLFIAPFVVHSLAGISLPWSFALVFGTLCLVPELIWLLFFVFSLPLEVKRSNKLWRERMASGFYKTLPPVEEDDDD